MNMDGRTDGRIERQMSRERETDRYTDRQTENGRTDGLMNGYLGREEGEWKYERTDGQIDVWLFGGTDRFLDKIPQSFYQC